MSFTIQTKFHGPTDTRGSRISVIERHFDGHKVRKYYDYSYAACDAHLVALELYLKQRQILKGNKWAYVYSDNIDGDGIVAIVHAIRGEQQTSEKICNIVEVEG